MNRMAAAFTVSFALAGSSVQAQAPAPPPAPADSTVHRHLGFALRLDLGAGYLATSDSIFDLSLDGGAGSFGIVIGGAVTENLILGAEIWDAVALSPSFTIGGMEVPGADVSLALLGIGVNLTYYFMPANIYISASPSITTLTSSSGGASGSTENGFGMKIAVGKEWWVGDHWGIGLAGQFFFSSNEDQGTNPPTWSTIGGGIAFSATYN